MPDKNRFIGVYIVIGLWLAAYIACRATGCFSALCNMGADRIRGEYYRWITGAFLHENVPHLLVNCLALYHISTYLEGKIHGAVMIAIGVLSGAAANAGFSFIYRAAESCVGGSVIVFPIIGIIAIMKLLKIDPAPFRLGTWYGNWMLGYAVIGNLFNGRFELWDPSTVLLHCLAFTAGCLLTLTWAGIRKALGKIPRVL